MSNTGDDDEAVLVPELADDDEGADGLDFNDLLGMVGGVGTQILEAQEAANNTVVEGQSGGGVVKVTVTGGLVFQSVTIDPEVVDPNDVDLLQDLVLAALHDAMARVNELGQAMNPLAGMDLTSMSFGGLDLGGIGAMLGLGGDDDDDDEDDVFDDDEDDLSDGGDGGASPPS